MAHNIRNLPEDGILIIKHIATASALKAMIAYIITKHPEMLAYTTICTYFGLPDVSNPIHVQYLRGKDLLHCHCWGNFWARIFRAELVA
jgi:hypothetical protein